MVLFSRIVFFQYCGDPEKGCFVLVHIINLPWVSNIWFHILEKQMPNVTQIDMFTSTHQHVNTFVKEVGRKL